MKKTLISILSIYLVLLMTVGVLNINAKDFVVTYKEGDLPLITDNNEHLAYQLNQNGNKLFAYNWKMADSNNITSYYVFGKNSNGQWINTSFADKVPLADESLIYTIGWNTGVIYNGKDYVIPSDVNAYKSTVSIENKVVENTGITIKTEFKFRNEGKLLEVLYHVKNNSSSSKNFLLWSGGDTELAANDHCTIGTLNRENARGVYLYSLADDYEDYPESANVQMPIFATADDDTIQFWNTDKWADIRDIYNRSDEEKYATSMTDLLSKPASYTANIAEGEKPNDTASIWYWRNQSLAAGEEKVYSVLIGMTNFTDNVENNIASLIEEANQEIEEETYQITFSLDEIKGGGTIPPQTIDSRGKVTRPETPIHEGNMLFDDWYTDDTYQTKFDFENTVVTGDTVIVGRWKLPPGSIKVVDPTTPSDVVAEIVTSEEDIVDKITLTPAEEAARESGKDVSVYIDIKDANDQVTDAEKEELEDEIDNDVNIATYVDIGLFKKVDGEQPTRINKSEDPIQIAFTIPDEFKNTDPTVERIFQLVKMDNGELVTIDLTQDGDQLTFETDDFSIYALAYVDKKISSINPNTVDGVIIYIIVFILSIVGIIQLCKKTLKIKRVN